MRLLLEFNSFRYEIGTIVLVKYWYNEMVTPVKIIEKKGGYITISHNIKESKIWNAPDQKIKSTQIIDVYRNRRNNN